ncbi:FadR/GntR family transcriptional regulator [Nisaea sediminum]|uniref:FadR/GntR family transcriptional regulator n=1 Tax=Nisaea sediminum TaxID=2775867 RepID=UPI001866EC19|nr:FCD domain-containing protein [Nisaea sediminum]
MGSHLQNSAVEDLATGIRGLIDERGLGVGDKLPSERELSELFATSRNTVREAMRMLKAYGVVDVRPKIGAVIIDRRMERVFDLFSFQTIGVSRETFADVQGFRSLLEVMSADRLIDRITDEDIAEMAGINEEMRAAADRDEACEYDFRFHLGLLAALGNRSALDVYRTMKPVILKIMVLGKQTDESRGQTYEQHEAILGALRGRNRIAYQYLAQSHLDFGLENFSTLFAEQEGG